MAAAAAVAGWIHLAAADSTRTVSSDAGRARSSPGVPSRVELMLQEGIKQGELKNYDRAESTFRQVLGLDPGNKLAWYNLGVVAQQNNRSAEALTAYDSALKTDPAYQPALFNKAILLGPGDTDQAVSILRGIVAADPKAAGAHLNLGFDLAKQGRRAEAESSFRTAVQLDPSLRSLVPEEFRDSARTDPTSEPTAAQAGANR
ncbi:tetratricopeptide repeat protein [Kitasatospora sp. SUK 42]|uniref:tetratricopeptide repeat protein n=1 Tax=Kitasatospora sp. SUK 42 TaxID=1588882 RepID=UPI0018CB60BB|nr:tetratricopeptide repeat protein [Kitasatospora sp. SUK 42]MBV2155416.1 tetratricopeptide repeat protein [Kitasatospora sp. SUK 42]